MALSDQKQLATINNCLANTHALLHKFTSAEDLYQQAVSQAESAGLPVTLAEIEGNIGNFALLRGQYDRALDYLERSRRRYASLGMPHQSAMAEQEIADAYLELNLAPEAADVYARVTQTFKELGLRAEEARALANHGRASMILGKAGDAQDLLTAARTLYDAEGNAVGEAMVMLSEAQLLHGQHDYQTAGEILANVEPVLAAAGSWQRLLLTRWLQAEIERELGHAAGAKLIIERTLEEASKHDLPQVVQRCETTLGLIANDRNDPEVAEAHFRRSIALTEEMRAPLPGEEFRTSFFSNKLVPYVELLKHCLAGGPARSSEALTILESARSRALAERLSGNFGGKLGSLTGVRDQFEAQLIQETEVLTAELNYIYNQLDRSLLNQSSTKPTESTN